MEDFCLKMKEQVERKRLKSIKRKKKADLLQTSGWLRGQNKKTDLYYYITAAPADPTPDTEQIGGISKIEGPILRKLEK